MANSRALSSGTGVGLVDGGAQSTLQVTLNGVSGSLETSSDGIIAKSGGSVTGRTLSTSGAGLTVADGNGVSGNPTFSLTGVAASVANLSGTGMLALTGGGTTVSGRDLTGTANQIDIANGNGASGAPTFAIANNATLPGTEGITIPAGTTAERPAIPNNGEIRYNTSTSRLEAYVGGSWTTVGNGDGTVTSVSGTANQISIANGSTTPVVSITTNPVLPGLAGVVLPSGTTGERSVSPTNGTLRYNTTTALLEAYLNGVWTSLASGSGVTSIVTGTGLTGGPITSTGTISIANTAVTAGSYGGATKTLTATVNAQGQLTALAETPIAIANTQVSGLGTMSTQNASAVAITGGAIDATSVGATTPSTGAFTSVAMTSGTITTAPTTGNDIVNKTYADAIASGINFHQSCRLATTTALAANTYNNGSSGVGATLTANANGALSIDGVAVAATNRILVKNEATQANNGVYTVTQTGSAGAPYILTRATDFDSAGTGVDQIDAGDFFLITAGSTLANTSWVQQTPLPITVGTTAIVFQQFGAPLTYSAGTGLNESPAYTFNIANTAVTSGSYGGAATVPTFSVNAQGQLTSATDVSIAIAGSQITSGTVAIANGGTGQTTAAAAITALTGTQTSAYYLRSNGTNATLSALSAADLTGTVDIGAGGTGQTTASAAFNALSPVTTTGDLIIGNGTNSATRLAIGANGYLLTSNGTTASWVAAPAGGVTSFSAGTTGLTPATGTTGAVTLAGTLAIANGGTNSTATATAGGAGYGTGTAHAYTAAGTAGQVLTSAGSSAPTWSGISGGTF